MIETYNTMCAARLIIKTDWNYILLYICILL